MSTRMGVTGVGRASPVEGYIVVCTFCGPIRLPRSATSSQPFAACQPCRSILGASAGLRNHSVFPVLAPRSSPRDAARIPLLGLPVAEADTPRSRAATPKFPLVVGCRFGSLAQGLVFLWDLLEFV